MPDSSVAQMQHRLASLAKESRLLADAQRLAEWVGTGRPLTTRGVLKPAAALAACRVLGIDPPSSKPRSALDIDELMRVWNAAVAAEFIETGRGQATAGPALDAWQRDDAEAVVAAWTQAVLAQFELLGDLDDDGLERLAVLAALHDHGGSAALDDLGAALRELDDDDDVVDDCSCPECAQPFDFEGCEDMAPTVALMYAEDFAGFGIATVRGEEIVELTPLGLWLTDFMFVQRAPAADVDAGSLVVDMATLPVKIAAMMIRPWLAARTPAGGARELMSVAESAVGQARLTALALARECGPEAAPAWRDWATHKMFGAYVRVWLAEHDGTKPADADQAWITVDTLAVALEALSSQAPAETLGPLLQAQLGDEIAEIRPLLANCDHPAAPRLLSLLTGRRLVAVGPPTTLSRADSTYQIKVQVGDVAEPPVWRRLHVPADIGLFQLSEVIQRAMGWDDTYRHGFCDGSGNALDFRQERGARLYQLLADVGDEFSYEYPLGDNWHHDISLEKILPDRSETEAVCTAGEGACPPEDCGGPRRYEELKATLANFDPTEFSVEDVNRRLAGDR